MPRRAISGTAGLIKNHNRGCNNTGGRRLDKCSCPWRYKKGIYNFPLAAWCGHKVDGKDKAAAIEVLDRITAAQVGLTFDPAGERKVSTVGGTTLTEFIGDWVIDHVEKHELNTDGLLPMLDVIKAGGLGSRTLVDLQDDSDGIEAWLHATKKTRKWGRKTFNEYRAILLRLFQRAVDRKKIKFNPIHAIARMKGVDSHRGELRHLRLTPAIEQRLLDACEKLNRTQSPNNNKLDQDKADAIRAAVEAGAQQKQLAVKYGVTPSVICSVIKGTIWNPERRVTTTKGDEMRRRVLGAFHLGPRAEELTRFQIKHVDWNGARRHPKEGHLTYKLTLPALLTKGGKTTGIDEDFFATDARLCKVLEQRRDESRFGLKLKDELFIFGTNNGRRVEDFSKSWKALFDAAGLKYGRDIGVVWHTIKHEFASRAVATSKTLAIAQDRTRHKDIKTLQRYIHTDEDAAWDAAMGS